MATPSVVQQFVVAHRNALARGKSLEWAYWFALGYQSTDDAFLSETEADALCERYNVPTTRAVNLPSPNTDSPTMRGESLPNDSGSAAGLSRESYMPDTEPLQYSHQHVSDIHDQLTNWAAKPEPTTNGDPNPFADQARADHVFDLVYADYATQYGIDWETTGSRATKARSEYIKYVNSVGNHRLGPAPEHRTG